MRIGAQPGSAGRLQPGRPSQPRTAIELCWRDETVVDFQHQIPFEVRWSEGIQCFRGNREPRRAGEERFEFGKFMGADDHAERVGGNANTLTGDEIASQCCELLPEAALILSVDSSPARLELLDARSHP